MFIFGHLGIGSKLASPFTRTRGLPRRAVLIGTLLPDVLDKPLYYILAFVRGKQGVALGLICGTRTFGHTALLTIAVALAALVRKSKFVAGLALGMATHLVLDNLGISSLNALAWPILGTQFPPYAYKDLADHLGQIQIPVVFWTEVLGLMLLAWDFWKSRYSREVLVDFQKHRMKLKKLKGRLRG